MSRLLLLLLITCLPHALGAQERTGLRAGPAALGAPTRIPAGPARAFAGPGSPVGPCDFTRAERLTGAALLGGALGAGTGYLMSVLTLGSASNRRRATLAGAGVGAALGLLVGASDSCPAARPEPAPPWERPRRRRAGAWAAI